MRTFRFRGKESTEYGVIVESISRVMVPARRDTRITIPGKDGKVDTGEHMAYDNIQLIISCGFVGANKTENQIS